MGTVRGDASGCGCARIIGSVTLVDADEGLCEMSIGAKGIVLKCGDSDACRHESATGDEAAAASSRLDGGADPGVGVTAVEEEDDDAMAISRCKRGKTNSLCIRAEGG